MPEPNSGCWLWLDYTNRQGYGRMLWEGRPQLAHRLSFEEAKGAIPDGLYACHKCDVPSCINPDHLFAGTPADNIADMLTKGRECRDPRPYQQGERNQNSKITEDVVRGILVSPLAQRAAAKVYGVAPSWVQRIRKREVWTHVHVPAEQIPPRRFFTKKSAGTTRAGAP